jgi:hypothetical protein
MDEQYLNKMLGRYNAVLANAQYSIWSTSASVLMYADSNYNASGLRDKLFTHTAISIILTVYLSIWKKNGHFWDDGIQPCNAIAIW